MSRPACAQEVSYGGQAVIEGVMIRSPRYVSVACRLPLPDGQHGGPDSPIDLHTEPVRSIYQRLPWARKVPLLRGFLSLFEMLGLGLRSLERSGNLQAAAMTLVAPWLATTGEPPAESREAKGALNGPLMWTTIAASFALGLLLFVVTPNWLADLLANWLGLSPHALGRNLIEGAIVLVMFLGYIALIGQMAEIRRVFQYHGAEHKVVNGHEAGLELSVDSVAAMSRIHPRCGTNFAFIVIGLSIIVYSFLPWSDHLLTRLGMRLCCLPLVAGLGFELIRLVGRFRQIASLQLLVVPGLWMQRITTREPSPDMIEVALASFHAVKLAEETGQVVSEVRPPAAEPAHA